MFRFVGAEFLKMSNSKYFDETPSYVSLVFVDFLIFSELKPKTVDAKMSIYKTSAENYFNGH